jgi:hypothetical protein
MVPQPARAHGDVVSINEVFMPGTIVVRTNERRLYYVTGMEPPFAILSASVGPVSDGRERRSSVANTFVLLGRRLPQ